MDDEALTNRGLFFNKHVKDLFEPVVKMVSAVFGTSLKQAAGMQANFFKRAQYC